VHWAEAPARGLYITGAWFKRTPAEPWMRVLWDARVAELFVPYASGSPRYLDLSSFSFALVTAGPVDAGPCGQLLGTPPKVVKELRDRGPAWKNDTAGYRGQELVLWGTLDAANYNYVMQYGFRDDGTITFRLGATAQNLPGREYEAHMHNGLWRIDIDLDGWPHDTAHVMKHLEPTGSLTASNVLVPVNGGKEGPVAWVAREFTELGVTDTVAKNGLGRNIMYDFMPIQHGTARHLEDFTRYDMWVTRYHPTETTWTKLPSYVNGESVTDADVVVWVQASMNHVPRDEDGRFLAFGNRGRRWTGVAHIMWSGFDLRPRNLFTGTPLYP
jgi:primary-amine oxidase